MKSALDKPAGERLSTRLFFEKFLRIPDRQTRRLVPLQFHREQAALIDAFDLRDADGQPVYDEIAGLWIKKSGKSETAAGIVLSELVGNSTEPDREIVIVAAGLKQSQDVTFASACRFVRRNAWLSAHVKILKTELLYRESVIDERTGGRHIEDHVARAVPAGFTESLHGNRAILTVFDEYHASNWDVVEALAPAPTRKAPRTLYFSYAGLKADANDDHPSPLWSLWQRWQRGDDPGLFVSYLGGPHAWKRIPWITERFINQQRRQLAAVPSKFVRLWQNEWSADDASTFLTTEEVADALNASHVEPTSGMPGVVYGLGVDLGLTHDLTGLIVSHANDDGVLVVDVVRTWRGSKRSPVNLEAVEDEVLKLARAFNAEVHLDQWQGAMMQQRISRQGLRLVRTHTIETAKLDSYASLLKALFTARQIRIPRHEELVTELETIHGEELKRRDRTRYTSGAGQHDDLVIALNLSMEAQIKWRDAHGRLVIQSSRLGRPQMAEMPTGCNLHNRGGQHVDCFLWKGMFVPCGHRECVRDCVGYLSTERARVAYEERTKTLIGRREFVQAGLIHPNRFVTTRGLDRLGDYL